MPDEITAAAARALPCLSGTLCGGSMPVHNMTCPATHRPAVEAEMRRVVAEVVREMVDVVQQAIAGPRRSVVLDMRQRARKWGVE